jgi:hypothetical protein
MSSRQTRYPDKQKAGRSPVSTPNLRARQEPDRNLFPPQPSEWLFSCVQVTHWRLNTPDHFVPSLINFSEYGSNSSGSRLNLGTSPLQSQLSQLTTHPTNEFLSATTNAYQAPFTHFQNGRSSNVGYDPCIHGYGPSANWEGPFGDPTTYPITVNRTHICPYLEAYQINDVLKFVSYLARDTSTHNYPRIQVTHHGQRPVNSGSAPRAQLQSEIYIENLGNERTVVGLQPPVTRGHSPASSQNSYPPSPSVISDDHSFLNHNSSGSSSTTARDRNGTLRCSTCDRTFARRSRLETCQNNHKGLKPHVCSGACGKLGW